MLIYLIYQIFYIEKFDFIELFSSEFKIFYPFILKFA